MKDWCLKKVGGQHQQRLTVILTRLRVCWSTCLPDRSRSISLKDIINYYPHGTFRCRIGSGLITNIVWEIDTNSVWIWEITCACWLEFVRLLNCNDSIFLQQWRNVDTTFKWFGLVMQLSITKFPETVQWVRGEDIVSCNNWLSRIGTYQGSCKLKRRLVDNGEVTNWIGAVIVC
jgi:hypothetical protein